MRAKFVDQEIRRNNPNAHVRSELRATGADGRVVSQKAIPLVELQLILLSDAITGA